MSENKTLQTTVTVDLFGTKYTISFPTIQQIIDIENLKQLLTSGQYGTLARAKTQQADQVLNYVDAVATFSVLVPGLSKAISQNDLMSLDILKSAELSHQYVTVFYPWYEEIQTAIKNYKVNG